MKYEVMSEYAEAAAGTLVKLVLAFLIAFPMQWLWNAYIISLISNTNLASYGSMVALVAFYHMVTLKF
jgi:hypothetical protein